MPKHLKEQRPEPTRAEAEQALMSALSLCRKAGKLVLGYDAAVEAVLAGKSHHVFYAADASQSTVERVSFEIDGLAGAKKLPLTQQQMLDITRKSVAIYAVTDINLARLCEAKRKQCEDLISKEEVSE